jgi:probable HAF family extracellular repeat protein
LIVKRRGRVSKAIAVGLCAVAAAVGASAASSGLGSAQARWVITDLGTLGGVSSEATGINERGWIVGSSRAKGGATHAFLWHDGRMTDLGTLGGSFSQASAINSRGQVVGSSTLKSGKKHAFLWESGRMSDLGTLGSSSWARAINERGQVVGGGSRKNGNYAFIWQVGRMADLGNLRCPRGSEAFSINDKGTVVGVSWIGSWGPEAQDYCNVFDAFLWEKGKMVDVKEAFSVAHGVNSQGQVVGYVAVVLGQQEWAFVLEKGKLLRLPDLGARSSDASAINERGEIVGQVTNRARAEHAALWRNGTVIDLSQKADLGGPTSNALEINNHGQIVGWSTTNTGQRHAVLWTLNPGS